MNIAGVEIGPSNPCRLVAEISNNHNGDLGNALDLIEQAKAAGADFIKLQCFTPQELVDLRGDGDAPKPWDSWSMRDLYEKAQTPLKWFPTLIAKCEEVDVPWFSSVFGVTSVAYMEAMECPAFKLASLDYGKRKLRKLVEATGKPIIQSCPNPTKPRSNADLMLYCPPGYPQVPTDLRGPLKSYDGLSYHGTDARIPMAAGVLGASLVEFHFQGTFESELEANVSLNSQQVAAIASDIKAFGGWL